MFGESLRLQRLRKVHPVNGRWAAAACLALALAGCADLPTATLTGPPLPPPEGAAAYDRDEFGSGWTDADGDGCDTRQEVLARDAPGATVGPDGCVDHVVIIDPYTGARVDGRAEIDIDHVVALADAWRSGAWAWDDDRRAAFANDPLNLLATSDDVNRAKSDDGPDQWRPPDPAAWCQYALIYDLVKRTYQLTVTPAQTAALTELRTGCGR